MAAVCYVFSRYYRIERKSERQIDLHPLKLFPWYTKGHWIRDIAFERAWGDWVTALPTYAGAKHRLNN